MIQLKRTNTSKGQMMDLLHAYIPIISGCESSPDCSDKGLETHRNARGRWLGHHRMHRCHGVGDRSEGAWSVREGRGGVSESMPDRKEVGMPTVREMPVSAVGMLPSSRSKQSQQHQELHL